MFYYENMKTFPENTSKNDMKLREYYKQEHLTPSSKKTTSLNSFILFNLLKRNV
jgi:hypothetical protein